MRRAFIAVTDSDWFEFLSHRHDQPEVNFWQPGGRRLFRTLNQGELFLFKLHSPNNYIVGGGFLATSSLLPVSIAWETFGAMNGVASLAEMRRRIEKLRRSEPKKGEDYIIGNIILEQPFFFRREAWIPVPAGYQPNVVSGMTYSLESGDGLDLWQALQDRLAQASALTHSPHISERPFVQMFSDPTLVKRRLGQGAFRVLVTDVYGRQCAVTREHTLPVLEAAHIRPVAQGGTHEVTNGLLLRSDVHTLFDRGYVTITPKYELLVSPRLEADWRNGKIYYAVNGQPIARPADPSCWPSREHLEWHADTQFLR